MKQKMTREKDTDNLKHAIETLRNMERRDTPATIILTPKMWNIMKKKNKKYVESSPYLKIIKQPYGKKIS